MPCGDMMGADTVSNPNRRVCLRFTDTNPPNTCTDRRVPLFWPPQEKREGRVEPQGAWPHDICNKQIDRGHNTIHKYPRNISPSTLSSPRQILTPLPQYRPRHHTIDTSWRGHFYLRRSTPRPLSAVDISRTKLVDTGSPERICAFSTFF